MRTTRHLWLAAWACFAGLQIVSGETIHRAGNTVLKLESDGAWSVYYRNELAAKHFVLEVTFQGKRSYRADPKYMRVALRRDGNPDRIILDFTHRVEKRLVYSVEIAADSLTLEPRMPEAVARGHISFLIPNPFINRATVRTAGKEREYQLMEDPNFPLQGPGNRRKLAFSRALHFDLIQNKRRMNVLLENWSFGKAVLQDARLSRSRSYQQCYRMVMVRENRPFTGRLTVQFAGRPEAHFWPVDLGSAANIGLEDKVAGDEKGGWNDGGPSNSLNEFPVGRRSFLGVPFDIRDPARFPDRVGIHLYAKKHGEFYPKEVSIPINRKAAALYFLQASAWGDRKAENNRVAAYILTYEDGSTTEQPIRAGQELFGWYYLGRNKNPACLPAWTGMNRKGKDVGIALYEWANPSPEKKIARLTLRSLETPWILGVLGITTSDRKLSIVRDALAAATIHVPRLTVACTYGRLSGRRWVIGRLQQMLKKDNALKFILMDGERSVPKGKHYGVSPEAQVIAFVDHKGYPQIWNSSALGARLTLSDEDVTNLRHVVGQGGGLFVSVPPVELKLIADMLPVEPIEGKPVFNTITAQKLVVMGKTDHKHPVTAGIRWNEMRPFGYIFPCRAKDNARTVARFSTGEPAIVVGTYGKGRVVYVAFPPSGSDVLGKSASWLGISYDGPAFYLKAFYWAAGNDKFADELSGCVPCHTLRDRYTEQAAWIALKAGDLAAFKGYPAVRQAEQKEIASLLTQWRRLDTSLSAADDLLFTWRCKEALAQYKKLAQEISELRNHMEALLIALASQEPFSRVRVTPGRPLLIGGHAFPATFYLAEPQHWPARKHLFEHYVKKYMRAGFNHTAYPAAGLNTFVKPGADPTEVTASDFRPEWFDDFFEVCARHGFTSYVSLMGPPHDSSMVGYHGREVNDKEYFTRDCISRTYHQKLKGHVMPEKRFGKLSHVSMFDPVAVKRRREALTIVAAHFRNMPAVIGFQNENEAGVPYHYDDKLDLKLFRERLKERFQTPAAMNAALGTHLKDFATIVPPRPEEMQKLAPGPNPMRGLWYAWVRFLRDYDSEYYQQDCKAILAGAPGKEMMERESPGNTVFSHRGILNQKEYENFMANYTTTGLHLSSNFSCDFMRGFAPGKRQGLSEWYNLFGDTYHGGIVARPEIEGNYRLLTVASEQRNSAFVRFNLWGKLARGVRVIQNHIISRPVRGSASSITDAHCLMQGDGYFKRSAYSQTKVAEVFRRMAGVLDAATPCSQIAILHSRASEIHGYGSELQTALGMYLDNEVRALYNRFMHDFQRQVDWIPPQADLSPYRVVLCPFALFLHGDVAENLLAYVRKGGVVFATGPIGLYDQYGKPDLSFLEKALGSRPRVVPVSKMDCFVTVAGKKKGTSVRYSVAFGNLPTSAATTAYLNGQTAWFMAPVGRGKLFVSGFAATASEAARDFLKQATEFVEPEEESSSPDISTFKCRNGTQRVLYLLSAAPGEVRTTVTLPVDAARVTDLRIGAAFYAPGRFDVNFPEMGCRIYAWHAE